MNYFHLKKTFTFAMEINLIEAIAIIKLGYLSKNPFFIEEQ